MSSLSTRGRRSARRTLALSAIAFIALAAPNAIAQPGTGGGKIYYNGPWQNATTGGTNVMTTMNSDGSGKTQLGLGMFGPPSAALHNNRRWFAYTKPIADSFYPDGNPRSEVVVFRDDYDYADNNTFETRVQLTTDPTLQPAVGSCDWVGGDDDRISFKGRRWSSTEPGAVVVEGGLYTATLAYGIDGNIVGLVAQPTAPTLAFPLGGDQWPTSPSSGGYDWNPAGTRVVYTAPGLWVADPATGSHTQIPSGWAINPQYSPDGSTIVYSNIHLGISTIKVNGTGYKEIIKPTTQWNFVKPFWSPTGSHVICTGQALGGTLNNEVFRATAAGKSLTNLTNTANPFNEWTWGWR